MRHVRGPEQLTPWKEVPTVEIYTPDVAAARIGAVIPGASIHVVNQATGVAIDTKSNDVGFYEVPGLFTGTYVITVTAPGMKTTTQSIELLVAQDAVVNETLTAGAVTRAAPTRCWWGIPSAVSSAVTPRRWRSPLIR